MKPEYAFPQSLQAGDRAQSTGGLTLRDYFAAQALNGLCANSRWNTTSQVRNAVESAYELADAMLAERARR